LPDELTGTRRRPAVPVGQVLAILGLFAALGAAAGWVWFQLWDAPPGVVADGAWYPDPYMPGQRADFDGVALYVLVALVAGALGGLVSSLLLARQEIATLVAVAARAGRAAWLLVLVGSALGPADPAVLARTADDGTKLSGALDVTGVSPYLAFPAAALFVLLMVFLATLGGPRLPQQPPSMAPWNEFPADR
jgi:hypothetical protein